MQAVPKTTSAIDRASSPTCIPPLRQDRPNYAIIDSVKVLVTFVLLAFFAITGEAASSWPFPMIQRADQVVNYTLNINGLGDAVASVYIIGIEPYPDEYQWMQENAKSPAYGNLFMGNATGNQTLTAAENYGTPEINDINNWYCEIFIDADNYMIGRLGESPDYSLEFDHIGDWQGHEEMTIYNLTASIAYENGYIAPFHEGPDPIHTFTPEPTSGMLLLVGAALLTLRRRTV